MFSSSRLFPVALGIVLAVAVPTTAAEAAAYIKFAGIDGESTDAGHLDWSDMLSFSHGYVAPKKGPTGGGTGRESASPSVSEIVVTKQLDSASPALALSTLQGTANPNVEIHLTKPTSSGPVAYYVIELKNVLVSSYNIGGGSNETPTEQFSLNFEEIKVTYTETDDRGQPVKQDVYVWKVSGKK